MNEGDIEGKKEIGKIGLRGRKRKRSKNRIKVVLDEVDKRKIKKRGNVEDLIKMKMIRRKIEEIGKRKGFIIKIVIGEGKKSKERKMREEDEMEKIKIILIGENVNGEEIEIGKEEEE